MKPFERNQSFALKRSTYALAFWIDDRTTSGYRKRITYLAPKLGKVVMSALHTGKWCECVLVCVCGCVWHHFGWQLAKSQFKLMVGWLPQTHHT